VQFRWGLATFEAELRLQGACHGEAHVEQGCTLGKEMDFEREQEDQQKELLEDAWFVSV
jgi:hypothetical protein